MSESIKRNESQTYRCENVVDGVVCGSETRIIKTFRAPSGAIARYHRCSTCGARATTHQPRMQRVGDVRTAA